VIVYLLSPPHAWSTAKRATALEMAEDRRRKQSVQRGIVTHVSGTNCNLCLRAGPKADGGERGIRTLETVTRLHAFQACAFDHSATSP
jgi:hypothetical protein